MRSLPAILLFATACGSDLTTLEVTCATTETISETDAVQPTVEVAETPGVRPLAHPVQTDTPAVPAPSRRKNTDPLCLSPSDELLGPVRASAQRFAERLEMPVVIGQGCIPITVQDGVFFKGKAYSGLASYSRNCVFDGCNTIASIAIDRSMMGPKIYNLAALLDHEIGHILSAWGRIKKVNMHVEGDYRVMSAATLRGVEWTQEDINLWCSASPCGRTELSEEWTYPVLPPQVAISDGGTSYLSDGVDAGGNVGGLTDGGY